MLYRTIMMRAFHQFFRSVFDCFSLVRQGLSGYYLLIMGLLMGGEAMGLSFSGPEVLKLDWNTRALNVSDINNDGLNDLVVINNDTAKIEILYQLVKGVDPVGKKRQLNRNRWEPVLEDAHFEDEAITIGFPLFDLAVGDLNGDGKDDLAYTGRESPLTIRFQSESGNWTEVEEFDGFEPLGWTETLEITDLDADGDSELVVIATDGLRVIKRGKDGYLHEKIYYITGQNPFNLKIRDITGDGRPDIIYITADGKQSLVLREQLEDGRFGPEIRFVLDRPVRALNLLPHAENAEALFCSVDSRSGILEFFSLQKHQASKEKNSLLTEQPEVYPIFKGRSAASYVFGDFNDDGLEDLLAANPNESEVVLFLKKSGYFQSSQAFPSFSEISSMTYGKFFQGDKKDIVIVSAGESTMGISKMSSEGRIEFPRQLKIGEGNPLVCRAVNPDGDDYDELALVSEVKGKMTLILARPISRENTNAEWVEISRIDLEGVKRKPDAIRQVAIFEDNRNGLMIFVPREAPVLLSIKNHEDMELQEVAQASTVRENLLKDLQPAQVSVLDVTGDGINELIVGRKGYARALQIKDGTLEMVDQFNARHSEDVVSAIIPLFRKGQAQQLAFYIEESGEFQIVRREADGVFRYDSSIHVGTIELSDWYQSRDSQGETEFIFTGTDRFWRLAAGSDVWSRVVESSYETNLENVFYNFVEGADFDQDGTFELVAIDGQNHVVEILSQQDAGLESLMYWEIFEQSLHYQGRNGSKTEPRQVVIADLTNDGKLDFAFLVHDRILFYPQQ